MNSAVVNCVSHSISGIVSTENSDETPTHDAASDELALYSSLNMAVLAAVGIDAIITHK